MFVTPWISQGRLHGRLHRNLSIIHTLKLSHRKHTPLPARKLREVGNLPPAPSGGERARLAHMPCMD